MSTVPADAPHVLVADLEEDALDLSEQAHHLLRVLRLEDGAPLSLTDGRGGHAVGLLDVPRRADARAVRRTAGPTARRAGAVERTEPPHPRLTLVQALAKDRRQDDAVRLACELGAGRIVPVVTARTQGRPDGEARAAVRRRWEAVAAAALAQSRGVHLASVDAVTDLSELAAPAVGALGLVLVPGADPLPELLGALPGVPDEVTVLVGPEGGLDPEEVALLVTAGWRPAGLGPTVLRTEHAGPVALAVVAASTGRWSVGR